MRGRRCTRDGALGSCRTAALGGHVERCEDCGHSQIAYNSCLSRALYHRVAISNRRLLALDERGVTFRYKGYRRNGPARYRTMTLAPDEFLRRFLLHVLPKGFHRIRHHGLLASADCKANLAHARELIAAPEPSRPPAEHDDADVTARRGGGPSPALPL